MRSGPEAQMIVTSQRTKINFISASLFAHAAGPDLLFNHVLFRFDLLIDKNDGCACSDFRIIFFKRNI